MHANREIFSCRITGADLQSETGDGTEIFPYWSFTKTVIAVCALRLAEQGRVELDAPVAGYDFTPRQLLNHTAGLPDYGTLPAYHAAVALNDEPWPKDMLFEATMAQGRRFAPGAGWAYSNLGYSMARDVLETATGQPFGALVSELVCQRLGLTSVQLATTREQFAEVYWPGARSYHPGWVYHGCLIGTAADAARLLHGLFTDKLLSAGSLQQMLVRYPLGGALEGRPWVECGYALGLMSGRCAGVGRAIGHSGGGPFSVNAVYHFPDLAEPVTVASFTDGRNEGIAEYAAVSPRL